MHRSIWLLAFCLIVVQGAPLERRANAQEGKVPPELFESARANGSVLVVVGLKVPWQLEQRLTPEAVHAQRQAIVTVQRELLGELRGTDYKITQQYETIPGIALEVGRSALAVLAKSARVVNVIEDQPAGAPPQPDEWTRTSTPPAESSATGYFTMAKVSTELMEKVKTDGTVAVLVGLEVAWRPEQILGEEGVEAQRQAIAAAQNELLAELQGTGFRTVRRYVTIPAVALKITPDALQALTRSACVTNVIEDRALVHASELHFASPSSSSLAEETEERRGRVPAELMAKARAKGTVLVLVGLKMAWQPEQRLSEEAVEAQRQLLDGTQRALLDELRGTRYRVVREYATIPGIALEAGSDALAILDSSARVVNVLEDRPVREGAPQSVQ